MLARQSFRRAASPAASVWRIAERPVWSGFSPLFRRDFSTSPVSAEPNARRVRRLSRSRKQAGKAASTKRGIGKADPEKDENANQQEPQSFANIWFEFRNNLEQRAREEEKKQKSNEKESDETGKSTKDQATNRDKNEASGGSSGGSNGPGGRGPNGGRKYVDIEVNSTQLTWVVSSTFFSFSSSSSADSIPEITYQEFKAQMSNRGEVARSQVINNAVARVYTRASGDNPVAYFTVGSVDTSERHSVEAQDALGINPEDRIPVNYIEEGSWVSGVFGLSPTSSFSGFSIYIGRRTAQRAGGGMGGMFGVGKTKAHSYNPNTDVKVRFADVAGMDEAKTEIMEFVQFLKTPEKYERLGAKIPRGAILSGAPGTGKTLSAKATAGEAGVPFFSVSGSEFVEMFSGVGASRVRDSFKKAKEKAPSMIWIDEIDAIGKARAGAGIRGGNDEREATLNQSLVEMDGFSSDEHVVVLAGTNRADMLDKASLRPGRFDRHINIDSPTLEGRKDIYNVHSAKIKYDHSIPELSGKLAAMTPGFSGADIANCCNEAALAAAREDAKEVRLIHFEKAVDRVIAGSERRSRVSPKDKRKIVAYHEAGHAVSGWFLKHADPLVKVTIVPHGSAALGYAQSLPSDATITTEDRMNDLITVALGGRVSEEIFFETVTVGASDDFKRITQIARGMVTDYGFSAKLGTVKLERPQGSVQKGYSEATDVVIDEEVHNIISTAHERCKTSSSEKKELVAKVAEESSSKEQLTRTDLVRSLGERPFKDQEHEAFKKYLDKN